MLNEAAFHFLLAHETKFMGSRPNWYQTDAKTCYIPKVRKCLVKKVYIKVSSMACRCVFDRPEHFAKGSPIKLIFEGLEMQKWNIPTDRPRRVYEKGVICLVIMFATGGMVTKMSKMADILYFLLMIAKNQSQFGQNN